MLRLLCIACLTLILTACSSGRVPPPRTADYYFQEGEQMFDRGLYEDAIANWEKVRESYYSPELNIIAELKIAEAHFLAEQYVEAAAAYEDFLKQHPNSDRVPEAMLQLGLSYYKQILAIDQDQTATENAMITFRNLAKRFPEFRRNEEGLVYADRCEDRLAKHEIYVGNYYLKTKHYPAAIKRFEDIFVLYPNFFDRDQAYYLLGRAYMLNGNRQKAITTFNTLFDKFPISPFILDAQKLVEKYY